MEKKDKRSLDVLPGVGISFRSISDTSDVVPFFSSFQVFSASVVVNRELVFSSLKNGGSPPLPLNSVCDSITLTQKCEPVNPFRVIKLARLDSMKLPEHRGAIFILLERIGCVEQIFPLSRFYYKVRLSKPGDESHLVSNLIRINKEMTGRDGPLFHSIFNGESTEEKTSSLLFRAPPPLSLRPPRRSRPSPSLRRPPLFSLRQQP